MGGQPADSSSTREFYEQDESAVALLEGHIHAARQRLLNLIQNSERERAPVTQTMTAKLMTPCAAGLSRVVGGYFMCQPGFT